MSNRKIWEIDFDVVGPISIANEISFRQEKGFDQHQFYSDIRLNKNTYGIEATITAYADNINIAETVAFVYFGRMRDVLALENDIPIQIYKHEGAISKQGSFASRRLLSKSDIITAFKMARQFELEQPKLLRAIGWYSKGKISQNTFDRFLAYWNVIEILGKEFHTPTDRTKEGSKIKYTRASLFFLERWKSGNFLIVGLMICMKKEMKLCTVVRIQHLRLSILCQN